MDFLTRIGERLFGTKLQREQAKRAKIAARKRARVKSKVKNPEAEKFAEEIDSFIKLIVDLDGEAIEGARDRVKAAHVPRLMKYYWSLKNWDKKMCVVDLIQDQQHEGLRKLMLDYLRVPPTSDGRQIAQASALRFVDEEYDQFMLYYNDRKLLAQTVEKVLKAENLTPAPLPKAKSSAPEPVPEFDGSPDERILMAAELGNLGEYKRALRDGADIDAFVQEGPTFGCSVLMLSLMNHHYVLATAVIEDGANIHFCRVDKVNNDPNRGQTALSWAAYYNQLGIIGTLLDMGANIDTQDTHGGTALHSAAGNGHLDCVRYLVERGADIRLRISDGRTAFGLATTNGRTEVVKYLLGQGNDIDDRCHGGWTPLLSAVSNGHKDIVEFLVENGANINAQHWGNTYYTNMKGCTPLYFSVVENRVRMTKYLLKHGADATMKFSSKEGLRSLLKWSSKQNESIRKALIEAGAQE